MKASSTIAGLILWGMGIPAVSAQSHPDLGTLADYPMGSRVWVGSIVGEVLVNPHIPVEINRPGEFQWHVNEGDEIKEGQVLGISGATKIELSERKLLMDRSRHRHTALDQQWAAEDKRNALKTSIQELEDRLTKLELTPTERELLGPDFAKRLAEERTSIETELKRSREKLESDYFDEMSRLDRQTLDLDLERAEEEHKELVRGSEVLAPASGKLRIESREIVRASTVMGTLVREGLAEVTIELSDPRLRGTPGTDLVVEIRSDDGLVYPGTFLRELEERTLSSNARLAVFQISPLEGEDAVPESLAGSRMVMVMKILPEPGHMVPKDELLFKFPKEINEHGWNAFIRERWPGTRIIYVAHRAIVVAPPDEN